MRQDMRGSYRPTASASPDEDRGTRLRAAVRLAMVRLALARLGIMVSALLWAAGSAPLDVAAVELLTGPALQRALARPASVTWAVRPFRDALRGISVEYQVATMLDRRIDPGRFVQLSIENKPLSELLEKLASEQQTSMTWIGSVAYFGPTENVRQLRTLVAIRGDEASRLPPEVRRDVMRKRSLEWEELTTPRGLMQQVAGRCNLSINNVDQLPHDLWAAGALPPMDLIQTFAVLGAGFDVTFKIDEPGKTIRIEKMPKRVAIDRFYAMKTGDLESWVARLTKVAPDAVVKSHRGQIAVRARIEDHDRIAATIRGEKIDQPVKPPQQGATDPDPRKVYSLKVEAPLAQLLAALGRQAGFTVKIKSEAIKTAGIDLDQIVAVDVKDASLDELLRVVLQPSGLAFRHSSGVVEVFPAVD